MPEGVHEALHPRVGRRVDPELVSPRAEHDRAWQGVEPSWIFWRLGRFVGLDGCGPTEVIVSRLEKLVDGDGQVAVGAGSAGPETTHEDAAVFAALNAEQLVAAVGAFVDGAGLAGPVSSQHRRCGL